MPRSEEVEWWYSAVYSAVQKIPPGKCTSYGHIAFLLDNPQRARQVGVCLKHLPSFDPAMPYQHIYHENNVPWQRVVNAKGGVSPRGDGGAGAARQIQSLRNEGITVNDQGNGLSEAWIDMDRWGWFPDRLPGEETDEEDSESEGHLEGGQIMQD